MLPTHGALPLPVPARSARAIDPFSSPADWPGLELAAGRIGVALDAEAVARFGHYRKLLLQRNAQHNLTGVRDPEGVERKLFLDALAMVPSFDYIAQTALRNAEDHLRLVDVGAGAGFPGLVLKIARPDLDLTLVDATAKKVAFLNVVIAELGLRHARAIHGRAEDLGQDRTYREGFDIATARAVARLPTLLEFVVPFLKTGGTALLPKGLEIDEELRVAERAAAMLGAEIVSAACLPVEGTRLVIVTKTRPTPVIYPRRAGIPSRDPLGEGI